MMNDENNPGVVRAMTPGEIAVGLTFNPSNDSTVQELKTLFAKAFDIVEKSVDVNKLETPDLSVARSRKMRDSALENIITAQMWAVKVATLKY